MTARDGSVLLVGVGGQGVVLASAIVADAALAAGRDVKQSEVHGMSQRGGIVSSHLRYGAAVASPLIEVGRADAIVATEWNEGLRALPYLRRGAPLVVNLHRTIPPGACRNRASGQLGYPALAIDALVRQVGDVRACDAMAIARDVASPRALNSVLLGVLANALPFPEHAWHEAIERNVPRGTVAANEKAFQAGKALRYPDETLARAATASTNGAGTTHAAASGFGVEVTDAWCKGRACGICVRVCPEYCLAIDDRDKAALARAGACTGCRLCEMRCPDFAIVVGTEPVAAG